MSQVAIHFGNYNTAVIVEDAAWKGCSPLQGIARAIQPAPGAWLVPSLIHLGDTVEVGDQVLQSGKYHAEGTFQDLKDHVTHPADVPRVVRGRRISHKQAASEYLRLLVEHLGRHLDRDFDLALICPACERDACAEWLCSIPCSGARSVTPVDEDMALAVGHGINLFEEDLLLVLDYGFSSIRARLVQFYPLGAQSDTSPVVRASARVPVGMADLKLAALCQRHQPASEDHAAALDGRNLVLHDPSADELDLDTCRPMLGGLNATDYVRMVLDRLREQARLVNLRLEDAQRVLLTGGGSSLSPVRRMMEEWFGEKVLWDPAGLAACRGGLAVFGDRHRDDMVRSAYSVRMRDPVSGEYIYPIVVNRFTRFPTRSPTARYIVNTYYDGQTAVNLEVFKISAVHGKGTLWEVVFGENKQVSIVGVEKEPEPEPAMEGPLVIPVDPPGRCGERRLHLEFNVDNRKRLRVSVRDLREQRTILESLDLIGLT